MCRRTKRKLEAVALFDLGENVQALWPPDGGWYMAQILKIVGGRYHVKYADSIERQLYPHQVRKSNAACVYDDCGKHVKQGDDDDKFEEKVYQTDDNSEKQVKQGDDDCEEQMKQGENDGCEEQIKKGEDDDCEKQMEKREDDDDDCEKQMKKGEDDDCEEQMKQGENDGCEEQMKQGEDDGCEEQMEKREDDDDDCEKQMKKGEDDDCEEQMKKGEDDDCEKQMKKGEDDDCEEQIKQGEDDGGCEEQLKKGEDDDCEKQIKQGEDDDCEEQLNQINDDCKKQIKQRDVDYDNVLNVERKQTMNTTEGKIRECDKLSGDEGDIFLFDESSGSEYVPDSDQSEELEYQYPVKFFNKDLPEQPTKIVKLVGKTLPRPDASAPEESNIEDIGREHMANTGNAGDSDNEDCRRIDRDEIGRTGEELELRMSTGDYMRTSLHEEEERFNPERENEHRRINTISVMTTSNNGSRKWDKKYYCCYCLKPQSKLPRHLESNHPDECDVVAFVHEKNKNIRHKLLCKIRNLGNHMHNCEVKRENRGTLVVAYRPSGSVNPEAYGPCSYCYGYYVMRDLWKHRCPLKPKKLTSVNSTDVTHSDKLHERVMTKSKLMMPPPTGVTYDLHMLFAPMAFDQVSRIVKSDSLILELAKREFFRVGHDSDQHNNIRTKLRELGRLLAQLRQNENKPNASLCEFVHAAKLTSIIKAVHEIAGFNSTENAFKVPSLALKIGHSIKKCATIVKATALESGDRQTTEIADNFTKLFDIKWRNEVSVPAQRTLYEGKRNRPQTLPTNEDIVLLSKYLSETATKQLDTLNALTGECAKDAWNLLNEITLTQIILFNRRRQGEVSKMKLDDFLKKHKANTDGIHSLSKLEQQLCKLFEVVEVVGKRGRSVPVLLTNDMIQQLTMLIKRRTEIGVATGNKHVFACSSCQSLGHIHGSDCMRKHSELAGISNHENLRSLKLRKHVATSSQMLALKENELDLLASYMGHDIRVHRQYYRLPDTVLRVAKLSKLFLNLEKGSMDTQRGQSLDEMTIEGVIEDDDGSSEEDTEEDDNLAEDIDNSTEFETRQPKVPDMTTGRKRKAWSNEEIAAIAGLTNILHFRLPGKSEITKLQHQHPILQSRDWKNIKDYLRNNRAKLLKV